MDINQILIKNNQIKKADSGKALSLPLKDTTISFKQILTNSKTQREAIHPAEILIEADSDLSTIPIHKQGSSNQLEDSSIQGMAGAPDHQVDNNQDGILQEIELILSALPAVMQLENPKPLVPGPWSAEVGKLPSFQEGDKKRNQAVLQKPNNLFDQLNMTFVKMNPTLSKTLGQSQQLNRLGQLVTKVLDSNEEMDEIPSAVMDKLQALVSQVGPGQLQDHQSQLLPIVQESNEAIDEIPSEVMDKLQALVSQVGPSQLQNHQGSPLPKVQSKNQALKGTPSGNLDQVPTNSSQLPNHQVQPLGAKVQSKNQAIKGILSENMDQPQMTTNQMNPSQLQNLQDQPIIKIQNRSQVLYRILSGKMDQLQTSTSQMELRQLPNRQVQPLATGNQASNRNPSEIMDEPPEMVNPADIKAGPSAILTQNLANEQLILQSIKSPEEKISAPKRPDQPVLTDSRVIDSSVVIGLSQKAEKDGAIPPPTPLQINKFVPEVRVWVDRLMGIANGQSIETEAKVSLLPESLGELEITISSQQGQITAQIQTENDVTKSILEGQQIQQLRKALRQDGFQVKRVDIVQPSTYPNQTNALLSQSSSSYFLNQDLTNQGETARVSNDLVTQTELPDKKIDPSVMISMPQTSIKNVATPSLPTPLSVAKLVPEIREWVGRLTKIANGQSRETEAKVSLLPEYLGDIGIKISTEQEQSTVKIETDTAAAKEIVEDHIQQLRQAIEQKGLQVKQLDIVQSSSKPNQTDTSLLPNSPSDKPGLVNKKELVLAFDNLPQTESLDKREDSLGPSVMISLPETKEKNFTVPPPAAPLPIAKLVPEVSKWAGWLMKITSGQSGKTEAVLSLSPEHLGEIGVKISSHQGQVAAQIFTDNAVTKEILVGQLPQLRQALEQQGFQVQKLDIVQQSPTANFNQTNFSFSQSGSSYPQEQRRNSANGDTGKRQSQKEVKEAETPAVTYGRLSPRMTSKIDFTA